jgi:hypothetical protein
MATRTLSNRSAGRRIALIFVLAAVGLMTVSMHPTTARADANGGSVGWQYSESGKGFYQPPHTGNPVGSDPVFLREWSSGLVWSCNPLADCNGATKITCGTDLPGMRAPYFATGAYEFARADAGDVTKWKRVDIDCLETPEFVPIEDIGYQFQYEIQRLLPQPTIDLKPNPETLVNLPTVISTDYPAEKTFQITVPPSAGRTIPLTGTINAHAAFTWTFEDGTTASGQGKPYDGTDPASNPGYYLTNTFFSAGHHTVTLTVTWTGTITVDTLAPEAFEPVTFTATAGVDVVESHPVNTAP